MAGRLHVQCSHPEQNLVLAVACNQFGHKQLGFKLTDRFTLLCLGGARHCKLSGDAVAAILENETTKSPTLMVFSLKTSHKPCNKQENELLFIPTAKIQLYMRRFGQNISLTLQNQTKTQAKCGLVSEENV